MECGCSGWCLGGDRQIFSVLLGVRLLDWRTVTPRNEQRSKRQKQSAVKTGGATSKPEKEHLPVTFLFGSFFDL